MLLFYSLYSKIHNPLIELADFYGVGSADYAWVLTAGRDDYIALFKHMCFAQEISELYGSMFTNWSYIAFHIVYNC
jgi:hypothetical protein